MTTGPSASLARAHARCCAVAALASISLGADPPRFAIQEILPVQNLATGVDLNAHGVVVGFLHAPGSNDSVAFSWRQGEFTVLPRPAGATTVWPSSIDDRGMIYGTRHEVLPGGLVLRPLAWRDGVLRELPGVFDGMGARIYCSPSGAHLVTDSLPFHDGTPGWTNEFGWEDELDFTVLSRDDPMPYAHHGGVTRPLGTYRGSESPVVKAVNDLGQAVGWVSSDGANQYDAILWDPVQGPLLLGSGGHRQAWPNAINNEGVVVGTSRATRATGDVNTDFHRVPFVWKAGRWEHIEPTGPYPDGEALDVNASGQVVGRWLGASPGYDFGPAWIRVDGTVHALDELVDPASGWSFTHVAAINDAGQVLAGEHVGPAVTDTRWALLTPVR